MMWLTIIIKFINKIKLKEFQAKLECVKQDQIHSKTVRSSLWNQKAGNSCESALKPRD